MESHNLTTRAAVHHSDAARPAMGFPLGTALLLIVIFCLSGFFSCCYHWDKLRSLRRALSRPSPSPLDAASARPPHSPTKPTPPNPNSKQSESQSLPVIMPGDNFPKYMAWPCPCQPLPPSLLPPLPSDKIIITVHELPPPSPL